MRAYHGRIQLSTSIDVDILPQRYLFPQVQYQYNLCHLQQQSFRIQQWIMFLQLQYLSQVIQAS